MIDRNRALLFVCALLIWSRHDAQAREHRRDGVSAVSPTITSEEQAKRGLVFEARVSQAGSDPMLVFTLKNDNSEAIVHRGSGLAPLDIGLFILDHNHKPPRQEAHLDIPLSYSIRDREIFAHDVYREAGRLSQWGFHLASGTYTLRAVRNLYYGRATLTAPTLTFTVIGGSKSNGILLRARDGAKGRDRTGCLSVGNAALNRMRFFRMAVTSCARHGARRHQIG